MTVHYSDDWMTLHEGHARYIMTLDVPDKSIQTIVTSPPYFGLRDYGHVNQLGTEDTLAEYVHQLTMIMSTARQKLADDGVMWLNLGDSYAGRANGGRAYEGNRDHGMRRGLHHPGVMPPRKNTTKERPFKNMLGVPWRVAFALQDDGWILRSDVIWRKTNAKPESVKDRPASVYEHLFLFSKKPKYHFNLDAIRQPRTKLEKKYRETQWTNPNPGDVWDIAVEPFKEAHFATFPPELARRCILSGSASGDTILDPFHGSGTTGMVALERGRKYVGIDLSKEYLDLSLATRFADTQLTGATA